ncbi:hypothetical protein NGB36_27675 [Streptomyces sp. RB6PN25]|uniref:Uncharacterized protein n=1 Tax=Streptomyces humicola TaxID=2953240 RepID=A0ABT1Q2U3_9ACTN|nr:hypothetical protein [Streptomyces humicola]MCQ4084254.1 hypothetical protein [Streptomyces humicola]
MTTNLRVGERPVEYSTRSVRTLRPESLGGWTVKRYAVSSLRDAPPSEVLDFARLGVRMSLPEPCADVPAHAFSVVHEDEDGCYVVVGWWSRNRLILHTRTWIAGWDNLTAPVEAPAHATACIWEMAAMAHERDAWVRHVVRPERPDHAAYLSSSIQGEY